MIFIDVIESKWNVNKEYTQFENSRQTDVIESKWNGWIEKVNSTL